eukprot:CAMPEP_0118925230 /NCGR_PEP_ID=MMETSP1169-20130426/3155_1 /TAXON_ID=36882 /ORGANISM="Pyramimonas obovata, Strain CCMP722" /LENGTH=217 /DNA_ID=CAMNT_0006866471 /DNA_START=268 /DNA_END=917 /DNA_ORIENTATION=+
MARNGGSTGAVLAIGSPTIRFLLLNVVLALVEHVVGEPILPLAVERWEGIPTQLECETIPVGAQKETIQCDQCNAIPPSLNSSRIWGLPAPSPEGATVPPEKAEYCSSPDKSMCICTLPTYGVQSLATIPIPIGSSRCFSYRVVDTDQYMAVLIKHNGTKGRLKALIRTGAGAEGERRIPTMREFDYRLVTEADPAAPPNFQANFDLERKEWRNSAT